MKKKQMNNNGFTLLEMMICFVLLGVLLVAAAQVISSTSQIYYYSKSTTYGMQASQVIITDIRGELEEAIVKYLNTDYDSNIPADAIDKCVYIGSDQKSIYFVSKNGERVVFALTNDPDITDSENNKVLTKNTRNIYNKFFEYETSISEQNMTYTPQYVGMNYKVKDISFSVYDRNGSDDPAEKLPTGDFPIIKVVLTVYSPKYGEFTSTEYVALYNFYGLGDKKESLIK